MIPLKLMRPVQILFIIMTYFPYPLLTFIYQAWGACSLQYDILISFLFFFIRINLNALGRSVGGGNLQCWIGREVKFQQEPRLGSKFGAARNFLHQHLHLKSTET